MYNFLNKSKFKYFCFLFFLLVAFIFVSAFSYVTAVSNNISENIFRLHVIANSNSKEDQALKYLVRDKVLDFVNSLSISITSKSDFIDIVNNNIDEINTVAHNTILENGYNYNVTVEIGNFAFPTKNYGDISFPAGFYDSIRIKIGNASGENWWCVMFPPLCFVDVSSGVVPNDSKEYIKNNLSDEEFGLISNSDEVSFKFKLIEFFQNFKLQTAKK